MFPEGNDDTTAPYSDLRWSRLKGREPGRMFEVVSERVLADRLRSGRGWGGVAAPPTGYAGRSSAE